MAKSLLVIDDSSTIREATQLALTGGEWELVTATNGAEAMEALQQHRVDIILCAVAPGDEDGYELCRSLGASAEGSGIPMLLMGGNVNATAALAVGASATLPKPFTAEQLQQALQETLEQSDFSSDFDDLPVTVADDAPLELEPLTDEFELQPAEGTGEPLELDEIEVIDLSDDDQFDDLELLDDLQPVELAPVDPTAWNELASSLDLGSTGDEELEDLLAGPAAVSAAEDLDDVPMDFTPDTSLQPAAERQSKDGGWTVDGLSLGGDESPAEPALSDPFPALAEETLADTDRAPSEDAGAELSPQEREESAGGGFDAEPEPSTFAFEATEELAADALNKILDEPDLVPVQAGTFSDLELEWAREAAQTAEDTSLPEEADADIALEELLQPAFQESSPVVSEVIEPEIPLDYEHGAALEDDEEDAWELKLDTGTTTPVHSPDADPLPTEAPLTTEMAGPAVPVDLAASVAASAGRAVREALEKSLSAEHLAPLVAAAVERVAWEVVPQLAERLIRETIARLQEDPPVS